MYAAVATTPNEADEMTPSAVAVIISKGRSVSSSRLKSIDKDECMEKNEAAEFLQALNRQDSPAEEVVRKVAKKRVKHPICDRIVVVIVVVGILFMMCTVLAALYLLLRILLSPTTTQRNSPFGAGGYGNGRQDSFHETNIEVKELIDKARRLISSSIGTRFLQPRGRLKSPTTYDVTSTTFTPRPTLMTSASTDS